MKLAQSQARKRRPRDREAWGRVLELRHRMRRLAFNLGARILRSGLPH